jgi:hypothetical protein
LQALLIRAEEMVLSKMYFECVVIEVVLVLLSIISPVAYVAPLMLLSAVGEQLVVPVKPLLAETTLRVTLEAALINSPWVVVAKPFVLPELLRSEQLMLVCEYFLVPRAEITSNLVLALDRMFRSFDTYHMSL